LFSYNGGSTFTELVFSGVESGLERGCWTTKGSTFTIVGAFFGKGLVLNVDLGVDVSREGFLVSLSFSFAAFYAFYSFDSLSGLAFTDVDANFFFAFYSFSGLSLTIVDSDLLFAFNSLSGLTFADVDADLLFATVLLRAILGESDVLFLVALAALTFRGDLGGSVAGFRVTFPSFLYLDLTLYFGGCGCFLGACDSSSSVTPVRGREDTERNRYPGVEVQIAGSRSFLLGQERTSWLLCGWPKKMWK
jgi:hypothetical protein